MSSSFIEQKYSRPVLYGIHLNTERIPQAMRKALTYDVIATLNVALD
jgi:hypothetical protein